MNSTADETVFTQIAQWNQAQELRAPKMKDIFYRNLEEALDLRRSQHNLITLRKRKDNIDFSSNDFLSLATSGQLREAFLEELDRFPNFTVGSTGSRLLDGNSDYFEDLEDEIASFHGAERALIVNSGFEGNSAIFSSIPRPGDAIVYDELVHASAHEGMSRCMAKVKFPFSHNCVESFREVLETVHESEPLIQRGQRVVLIAVETVYSMDGDVCPLKEMVEAAKEVLPKGNFQFIVDEAHATGVIGEKGVALVSALGLEKDIAIRLHTFSKALGASGAAILCNDTVRTMLVNHARPICFTTAASFPTLAAIKAAYSLLKTGKTEPARMRLQEHIRHFYKSITNNRYYKEVRNAGIIDIPLAEDWESQPILSHIVAVLTEPRHNYFLSLHLQLLRFWVFPVDPPAVPKGTNRVRIAFHASITDEQVEGLVNAICDWAKEMLDIKKNGKEGALPTAAQQVYKITSLTPRFDQYSVE
ncbi:class II aminotransferase 8-amino-7-oxononanoate synthase [Colletotrichum truncatum]|uniref:Class II aminotransferase 8-amino-7-oxononanoate synthase n=1 Tax=Colletotrichum truncatum TaxID=5467 RepID=A0ACC3ZF48_COLTU|nr:class II aminotransferase 8-amino-7-oxononanoate synthase [Colletotrichum truncatum]KAF6801646.1 class II aminotransferase 8-amino-7-oxononanoate synthase [Colletotrichum truncatum]